MISQNNWLRVIKNSVYLNIYLWKRNSLYCLCKFPMENNNNDNGTLHSVEKIFLLI